MNAADGTPGAPVQAARPGDDRGGRLGDDVGGRLGAGPAAIVAPGAPDGPRAAGQHRTVLRQLGLLVVYLAAGVAVTWPRATYITGRLPRTRDVSNYVWGLEWTAHQVIHLGNPWFTTQLAAPVGIQLGFGTNMPLAGLIMTPVTLAFGPSAAFTLLTIAAPGLACYVMYRAARLWLAAPGAIAAGALFGLSAMLTWQDWYHLNIALGTLFLPMTLEAAVRLRRRPGRRQAIILGLVLGASVLINQESAALAAILAALILLPWLLGLGTARPADAQAALATRAKLTVIGLGALVAVVIGSPQLIAMAQQALAGGASIDPTKLVSTYVLYGAGLPTLFAPSPRLDSFGMHAMTAAYTYHAPDEGVATFGVLLTVLALAGLAASRRRRPAWLLALLWGCCAVLALGPTLIIGTRTHIPVAQNWHGTKVSLLMPYTWLVHIPVLSGLREADRFALLGLIGAAILAGAAVDWLARHARPLIIVVAAAAFFEAGWAGSASVGSMPTTLPALDGPIAADQTNSIVVDVPYGLRGGIPLFGSPLVPQEQLLATSDRHPRAISYTAWVPEPTVRATRKHPFYVGLAAAQRGHLGPPALLQRARQDGRRLGIGWALVWRPRGVAVRYLIALGFRFDYRADGVSVYRPRW